MGRVAARVESGVESGGKSGVASAYTESIWRGRASIHRLYLPGAKPPPLVLPTEGSMAVIYLFAGMGFFALCLAFAGFADRLREGA